MAHVADHLSVVALEQQYRSCTDVTAARHFQGPVAKFWRLPRVEHAGGICASVVGGGP
jgi:hypothetical protein